MTTATAASDAAGDDVGDDVDDSWYDDVIVGAVAVAGEVMMPLLPLMHAKVELLYLILLVVGGILGYKYMYVSYWLIKLMKATGPMTEL